MEEVKDGAASDASWERSHPDWIACGPLPHAASGVVTKENIGNPYTDHSYAAEFGSCGQTSCQPWMI